MNKDIVKDIRELRDKYPNTGPLDSWKRTALTRLANALTHWPPSEETDIDIIAESVMGWSPYDQEG